MDMGNGMGNGMGNKRKTRRLNSKKNKIIRNSQNRYSEISITSTPPLQGTRSRRKRKPVNYLENAAEMDVDSESDSNYEIDDIDGMSSDPENSDNGMDSELADVTNRYADDEEY